MLGKSSHPTHLTSMISNMTLSHYVAFVRKQIPGDSSPSWTLFNDEKVAKAADVEEMKKFAYVYFFRRS